MGGSPVSETRVAASGPVDLTTRLGSVELRNPVLMASGTFGYGSEFAPFLDLTALGGFVAKSLTLEPRFGINLSQKRLKTYHRQPCQRWTVALRG